MSSQSNNMESFWGSFLSLMKRIWPSIIIFSIAIIAPLITPGGLIVNTFVLVVLALLATALVHVQLKKEGSQQPEVNSRPSKKKQEKIMNDSIQKLREDEKLQKIVGVLLEKPNCCPSLRIISKTGLKTDTVEEKIDKLKKIGLVEKINLDKENIEKIGLEEEELEDEFPSYRLPSFIGRSRNKRERLSYFTKTP